MRTVAGEEDVDQTARATAGQHSTWRNYEIHSKCALSTLLKIRDVLKSGNAEPTDYSRESVSIQVFDKTGQKAWQPPNLAWATLSYKSLGKCEFLVSGSPGVLIYLCEYTDMLIHCSPEVLSVCHPTPQTLHRLLTSASTLHPDSNTYTIKCRPSDSVMTVLEKLTNCNDAGLDAENRLISLRMDKYNCQRIYINQ